MTTRNGTRPFILAVIAALLLFSPGCKTDGQSSGTSSSNTRSPALRESTSLIVVDNLVDATETPDGSTTLRMALELVADGGTVTFDPSLDNGTIDLAIVATDNTRIYGETFVGMTFDSYAERDYGKSALYAAKDVTIDASALPSGITLRWTGGESNRARVLAVLGNLTMMNVAVTGGWSSAEATPSDNTQPYTLARGGGLAVWGLATLDNCTLFGNRVEGDNTASRDRGAFGGGIYANGVALTNCVVSGNRAKGFGAAGGGIYSVGGAENLWYEPVEYVGKSVVTRCAVTGNRVTGQHAYGGGIYSDGGGPGNLYPIRLSNCTVARNLVEDNPDIPNISMFQYYFRGGGFYMSNGYLEADACTIVENRVTGMKTTFSGGKPNMGGGGVAATIGNAHTVEYMEIWHSVIAGNTLGWVTPTDNATVHEADDDVYTGSLLHFFSHGYNRFGTADFSQILVPVPDWYCMNRKHYPKIGDADGVALDNVLSVSSVHTHSSIVSAGTDIGENAVLWYPPTAALSGLVPLDPYSVQHLFVDPGVSNGFLVEVPSDDLLRQVITWTRDYAPQLGADFGAALIDNAAEMVWYEENATWPSDPRNAAYIAWWRALDNEVGGRLGDVCLGEDFWEAVADSGRLSSTGWDSYYDTVRDPIQRATVDQLGTARWPTGKSAIGAIEGEAVTDDVEETTSGGGGGGCSVADAGRRAEGVNPSGFASVAVLLLPAGWIAVRRRRRE